MPEAQPTINIQPDTASSLGNPMVTPHEWCYRVHARCLAPLLCDCTCFCCLADAMGSERRATWARRLEKTDA